LPSAVVLALASDDIINNIQKKALVIREPFVILH